MKNHLPQEILKHIDLGTLYLENVSFLDDNLRKHFIEIFFKYLTKSSEVLDSDDYQKSLDILPEGGGDIMNTLAEQWIREGRAEGRAEGETKGQQDLLITAIQEK